jgi:16S rRNA (guanine1207-N2)-methyltransferase
VKETIYEMKLGSKTSKGREIYEFKSSDGVPSKDSFRDSELALADAVNPAPEDDILVIQSGYGFLPVVLADQAPNGETVAGETSDRAYQLIKLNLDNNEIENCTPEKVAFYNEISKTFDKIVYAPRGYEPVDVVKNRLSNAVKLLEKGGEILIAGKKTSGINRYQSHLKSFAGKTEKVTQNGKQRVYRYIRKGEFEPENIDIETNFKAKIDQIELEFAACEGLFSPKSLDDGSRLLIENIKVDEEAEVLDLACGYGIVGIFVQKLHGSKIFMTDDNRIATHFCRKNAEETNVECKVKNRDCLDGFPNKKFDAIVSNPPTHQGEEVTDEMFSESHRALKDGGSLYLVYNQNMRFEEKLSDIFSETEKLEKSDNYVVLEAIKQS